MSDTAFVAIVVGFATTFLTLVGSIVASRRWGLPGLAREVDRQREEYIVALEKNNGRLERENRSLRTELDDALARHKECGAANRDLRAKLAVAYDDIADLYRKLGAKVPPHVASTRRSLGAEEAE